MDNNERALAVLKENQGKALVFARREEIENIAPQYEPIVTVLDLAPSDFVDVGMGNMYPGKSATNRISDAAGVSFLHNVGGTREVGSFSSVRVVKQAGGFWMAMGEYKVIGTAQGQRLKPDGTPRLSSLREYSFDVVDRANEDFLKDFEKGSDAKYRTEVQALKHLLDLKKFATQRAATGAELGVIRELVGMPTAFKKDQIGKPLVFSQIVENNRFKVAIAREIMQTPDGRKAVVDALFGTSKALFGPQAAAGQIEAPPAARAAERQVGPEAEASTASPGSEDLDFGQAAAMAPEPDQAEAARNALRDYIASGMLSEQQIAVLQPAVDNPGTLLDGPGSLLYYLDLCKKQEEMRKRRVS